MSNHTPGDWIDETYRLERVAGQGAMGQVWRAFDGISQRPVALKLMSPQMTVGIREYWMFVQEAHVLARFHHPGIVHAYALGLHGSMPYMALEWVEGQTLQNLWRPETEPHLIFLCFGAVLDAVSHVHARGVIHRDLKPSNILIQSAQGPQSTVGIKLLDFGVSKIQELYGEQLLNPRTLGLLDRISLWDLEPQGTPRYMPPEVYRGSQGLVSPASDIFSLGVILFELLTGTRFFDSISNDVAVVLRQSRGEVPDCTLRPSLASLRPPEFLLKRMLDPDPFARPQSIAEVRRELFDWFSRCVEEHPPCRAFEPYARVLWSSYDSLEQPTSPLWDLGQARCVPEARLMTRRILPLVGRIHEQATLWRSLEENRAKSSLHLTLLQGHSPTDVRRVARWAAQTTSEKGRGRVVWSVLSSRGGWSAACAEAIQKSLYADPKTLQSQDVLRSSLLDLGKRPWTIQDSFTTLPGRSIESILAQSGLYSRDPHGRISGQPTPTYQTSHAEVLTSFLGLDQASQDGLSNIRESLDRVLEEAGHVASLGSLSEQLCTLQSTLCADVFWCLALQCVRKGHLGNLYAMYRKIFASTDSTYRLQSLWTVTRFAAYTYNGYGGLRSLGEAYIRPFRSEFIIAFVRERMMKTSHLTQPIVHAFASYAAAISSHEGFVWILDALDSTEDDRRFLSRVITWLREAQAETRSAFSLIVLCEPGFTLPEEPDVETLVCSNLSDADIKGFIQRFRLLSPEDRTVVEESSPTDFESAHDAVYRMLQSTIPVPDNIDFLRALHAQSPWEPTVTSEDEALWLQVCALRTLCSFGDTAFTILLLAACVGEFVSFRVLMTAWQHQAFDSVRGDETDVLSKSWEFWVQHNVWIQESARKIFFRESALRARCLVEAQQDPAIWSAWNRALSETYRSLKLPTTPQESIDCARFYAASFEGAKAVRMGMLSAERFEARGEIAEAWRSYHFCCQQPSTPFEQRSQSLEGFARTSLRLGDLSAARPCIDELVRAGRENGDLLWAGRGILLLGHLCVLEGRLQEALACFDRAQGWFGSLHDGPSSAQALLGSVHTYVILGNLDICKRDLYTVYTQTLRGLETLPVYAHVESTWALVCALSGDQAAADSLWTQCVQRRATSQRMSVGTLCRVAEFTLISGRIDESLHAAEEGLVRGSALGDGRGVFEHALLVGIASLVSGHTSNAQILQSIAQEWLECSGAVERIELEFLRLVVGVVSGLEGAVEDTCALLWGTLSEQLEALGAISWKVGWAFACLALHSDRLEAYDPEIRNWVEQQARWYIRVFPCPLLAAPLG